MNNDFNPKNAVFTPAEVSSYAVQYLKDLQAKQHRAVSLGMAELGNYFAPMIANEMFKGVAA